MFAVAGAPTACNLRSSSHATSTTHTPKSDDAGPSTPDSSSTDDITTQSTCRHIWRARWPTSCMASAAGGQAMRRPQHCCQATASPCGCKSQCRLTPASGRGASLAAAPLLTVASYLPPKRVHPLHDCTRTSWTVARCLLVETVPRLPPHQRPPCQRAAAAAGTAPQTAPRSTAPVRRRLRGHPPCRAQRGSRPSGSPSCARAWPCPAWLAAPAGGLRHGQHTVLQHVFCSKYDSRAAVVCISSGQCCVMARSSTHGSQQLPVPTEVDAAPSPERLRPGGPRRTGDGSCSAPAWSGCGPPLSAEYASSSLAPVDAMHMCGHLFSKTACWSGHTEQAKQVVPRRGLDRPRTP